MSLTLCLVGEHSHQTVPLSFLHTVYICINAKDAALLMECLQDHLTKEEGDLVRGISKACCRFTSQLYYFSLLNEI